MSFLEGLRIVFASAFVLFVPGFVWSYVFFARKNIDWIERIALSVGLSIALVPLAVFWLRWLFDVRVTLFNTCLVVVGLTVIGATYVVVRRPSVREGVLVRIKSLRRGKGIR